MSFETSRLKALCLVSHEAEAELGDVNAKELVMMLADIEAQGNGQELLDFMGDFAQVKDCDRLEVSFGRGCCALFAAVGKLFQRDAEGNVTWSTVRRLKLLSVEKCNGHGL